MPIVCPEPFGLVMIEAMACGLPVIAFNRVNDEAGAVAAVSRLNQLSRKRVRSEFMARFTARRMAEDYVVLYRNLARRDSTREAALLRAAE